MLEIIYLRFVSLDCFSRLNLLRKTKIDLDMRSDRVLFKNCYIVYDSEHGLCYTLLENETIYILYLIY